MRSRFLLAFVLVVNTLVAQQPAVSIQQYVTGFTQPVDIANCDDDRLFIVEQTGFIRIIDGQGNKLPQPFLDIDSRVNTAGEQGLLGLAFHPAYKDNGYFFVYYTNNSGDLAISRFSVTADSNMADASSETPVITIPHPTNSNHNGGNLEFGPDGYLYIATGDGGGSGDPGDNAQDPLDLLGKVLRLDVDTLPYQFPPDNPYFGFASVRNEIWARGLRNPWRFSFDRVTGDLWIGDVGQNTREEINLQPASSPGGENYGWKCYEGNSTYGTSGFGCNHTFTFPVHEYVNPTLGQAVTGGYVYRGCRYPALYGYYLFADNSSDRLWTLHNNGGTWVATEQLDQSAISISTFGEDQNGELYIAGVGNGVVYKVVDGGSATITAGGNTLVCPGDPVLLSAPAGYDGYEWFRNGISIATGLQQFTAQDSGQYTVVVTRNNSCTYTTPAVTVTFHPLPTPTVVSSNGDTICSGTSTTLSVLANYEAYLWSTGQTTPDFTVTGSGEYWIEVTDSNGCKGADTIQIVALPSPIIAQDDSVVQCGDGVVELFTDSAYAGYMWSTGDTSAVLFVTESGTFNVTVTNANGCSGASDSVEVEYVYLDSFEITLDMSAGKWCVGPIYLDSSYSYEWYYLEWPADPANFSNYSPIPNSDAPCVPWEIYGPGHYYVKVFDNYGCSMVSENFYSYWESIEETWLAGISLQPNPFTNEIILDYTLKDLVDVRISLKDLTGKEIALLVDEKKGAGSYKLAINTVHYGLSRGLYLLEIANGKTGRVLKVEKM